MASASETPAAPAAAPAAAATPAPALPAIPQGTGIFAQASTLPFEAPDFSKIKDSDYQPAIEQGIAIQKAEVAQIANNPEAPTFDNTIVALEKSGRMLTRVYNVFSAVQAADTNDTLDKIDSATSPQLAGLRDSILLDDKLFARVRAIYDARESLGLAPDQLQLLKITYDSMVHNGALLSAADKATLKGINEKISSLSTDFGQKLTAGTRDGALIVANKAQLAGMSPAGVAAAAKAASDRGKAGYLIPLQNTTQQPALSSLSDRATRKALFEQSWTRSEKGDANDTRADAAELAQLRAEKAKLLGYPDYASYALFDQMAKTPATAIRFMDGLVPPLRAEQDREVKALDAVIAKSGGKFAVKPWDWSYYAEKLRKAKYDLDDAQVKPYFEITNVLENGVFYAANQLYGLTFRKRTDIPVYNPDVTVYEVFDQDGSPMALFYFDPWKRDNKQGGAWMSNFVEQSTLLGTKPVVFNVENFTKPAAGQPALVSFDDVTTMFHEFGHALHGMLSNQRYPSIAGTSTARDFVEFPSQFNENWATDPKVLANYAKNYKTGAPMPKALMDKVIAAKKFNQGYDLGEIVAAALLDMKWHSLPASAGKQDVDAFEAKALGETGLDVANVPTRYRSSYFRHIWANGYAAGYYAYLWTEMLDHDAFQWFEDHGGLTRANGQRFRDMILSRGHSEDYGVMFRNFTGHDPEVGPMIKARGLDQVPAR
ncbi:MAG: M3 family metallopeptidase [Sphingomonadales bacterium]|nr:M3 family metallopeptidase [Sphingomonadales bacterium]MDE2570486.1 M3 family metallopeptidase [Sphingomonadales bacterium]